MDLVRRLGTTTPKTSLDITANAENATLATEHHHSIPTSLAAVAGVSPFFRTTSSRFQAASASDGAAGQARSVALQSAAPVSAHVLLGAANVSKGASSSDCERASRITSPSLALPPRSRSTIQSDEASAREGEHNLGSGVGDVARRGCRRMRAAGVESEQSDSRPFGRPEV